MASLEYFVYMNIEKEEKIIDMDGYLYDMDISKIIMKKRKRFAACLFSPVFVSVITASG